MVDSLINLSLVSGPQEGVCAVAPTLPGSLVPQEDGVPRKTCMLVGLALKEDIKRKRKDAKDIVVEVVRM